MFQTVIAVLIGLSFLYFILAVLCSGVKEFIAAKLNFRAATLESAIGRMLANGESAAPPGSGQSSPAGAPAVSNLGTAFYSHPLIQGLAYKDKNPSYIPTRYFSTVLEQILRARQIGSADYAALIHNLPEGQLKETLSALAERSGNEAEAVRKEIEIWFDSTMDRVSEWYKRQAQNKIDYETANFLMFDFDNGTASANRMGDAGPVALEGMLTQGDSGGRGKDGYGDSGAHRLRLGAIDETVDRAPENPDRRHADQCHLRERDQRLRFAVAEAMVEVGRLGGDAHPHQRRQAGDHVERGVGQRAEHRRRIGGVSGPAFSDEQH